MVDLIENVNHSRYEFVTRTGQPFATYTYIEFYMQNRGNLAPSEITELFIQSVLQSFARG